MILFLMIDEQQLHICTQGTNAGPEGHASLEEAISTQTRPIISN